MSSSENEVDVKIKASSESLAAGMTEAVGKVQEGVGQMKEHFGALGEIVEKVQGYFLAMTAVVAGGSLFAEAINETKEITGETKKLAMVLGESYQEARALSDALGDVGSSTEAMLSATTRITTSLRKNEEAFIANKVATRDSSGEFLNAQQVIANVTARLGEMQPGYERNALATQLLGRNWLEILPIGKVTEEMLEEVKQKQIALNSIVTGESIEAVRKYKLAMKDIADIGEAVALNVGNEMIPRFTELAEWFAQIGPAAVQITMAALNAYLALQNAVGVAVKALWDVFVAFFTPLKDLIVIIFGSNSEPMTAMTFFINVCKVVEMAVIEMRFLIETALAGIGGAFSVLMAVLQKYGQIAKDVMFMEWDNIEADWKTGTARIEKAVADSAVRIAAIDKKFQEDFEAAAMRGPKVTKPDAAPAKGGTGKNVEVKKDKEQDNYLQQLEAGLAQRKITYMLQNDLREMDKESEKNYWLSALQYVEEGSKNYLAIKRKADEAEIASLKKKQKDRQGLEKESIDQSQATALSQVQAAEMGAQQEYDVGTINKTQLLQQQAQFEAQRIAIQAAAQRQRIEMLKQGADDPAAMQAAKDKLIQIEQDYANRVKKINLDLQTEINSRWKAITDNIAGSFASGLTGMLTKTTTFRSAMASIFTSLLNTFISNLIVPMVSKWAAAELAKTAATQEGTVIRWILESLGLAKTTATQAASSAETAVVKKTEAAATIPAEAAEAAGAAAGAVAGIPVVGPALAVAAYAETLALVMSGLSMVSAAGGMWQVPNDQLAMIHKDEQILPAGIAQDMRDVIGAGGRKGSSGGLNLAISTFDSKSFLRFAQDNSNGFARAIKTARRNADRALRTRT